ncbi:MAG: FtsX-like permease family protein, partial [Romboutsia sp.]|nr:FtsX-like permease family protein [Romboutsia sp.]
ENGQKELDKQKEQLLEGESQLSLAKEQLDNTKQLFLSQGIDPDIEIDESNTLLPNELVAGILKYQGGLKEYNTQLANINKGKIQLEEAQRTLNKSKEDLQKGKAELEEGKQKGQLELSKAKQELENAEQEIINGQNEIDENRQKLIDGRKEIDDEKEKLKQLDDSKYYFFGRVDNPGYSTYKGSIDSLDKIALVFPVFFFLVAALICLTTMTRMVEENRIEIGTLKAIGYTDLEISRKFVVYAALASIAGCIVGILVGSILLPNVINIAYSSTFTLPQVKIKYYLSYIIQSLVASLVCTVGAALIVLKEELRDNPSNLMRSKAPKLGKKILLERITPLWSRLNFNQKVTFRNLFRYKQRMLMTILGVSGCMALLVTGMALEESNSSLTNIQFDKLINYDAIAIFKDKSTEKEDTQYNESLNSLNGYDSSLNIYQESVTFSKEGMSKQTATMYVPQNKEDLNNYILLNDRKSKEKYNLSDNGVIITEKLAKLLDVSVGDNIVLKDSDNKEYSVKVDHIVENYLGHYIYMSPKYYEEIFKSKPVYNAQLLKFNSKIGNKEKAAEKLMQNDKVVNVTLTSKMKSMSESADLGLVVIVIIIASGSLAFVVLYNLININVSERIREISTIKVLGFHDREVDMYIFRENIILTILGILTGTFMGNILYLFLISTAEMDNMMMIPTVSTTSYIISGLITMVFAILVMVMMHFKLKNINMIDALKSIE